MNIQKLKDNKDNLKSIGQRLIAPSPTFFKKIIKLSLGMVATAGAVLLVPVTLPTIILPSIIVTVCTNIVIAGTATAGVAKMGVDWGEVDKKENN